MPPKKNNMPPKKKTAKMKPVEKDPLQEIVDLLDQYDEGTEPRSAIEHGD